MGVKVQFCQLKLIHTLLYTYYTFSTRAALTAVGLLCEKFTGHSFQIEAATLAARAGVEDYKIHQLGQWNSTAFLVYICTSHEDLAQFSKILAQA